MTKKAAKKRRVRARKFTSLQVPADMEIADKAKRLARIIADQADIPGVTVHMYSAIDIALDEAIQERE
tara:strand:- start:166 stop:369 length:204 start_codon:yes stop_codon:yes gene_type:complete